MKKILAASAIAMALAATGANAAQTTLLKVTGKLAMAACTPALGGGGTVDYGNIALGSLSATETNRIGEKDVSFSITCPAPTKAAWAITDDRANTLADNIVVLEGDAAKNQISNVSMTYGVGDTAGNVHIGMYTIYADIANVTADGVKVDAISGATTTPAWTKSTTGIIKNGEMEMMTVAATGTTAPLAYTTAVFPLKTVLAVQNTGMLKITDDTKLDGQATITIKYL
ncbi:TPA: DUF1120 domain-containing protein [Kluyvera ascorbata]|nr:DUF1120 domain-containing protein [Kluyvera ascorbata]